MRIFILLALITVTGCVADAAKPQPITTPLVTVPLTIPVQPTRPRVLCGPTVRVIENLTKKYGEQPMLTGLTLSKNLLQVYVNMKTGTWTVFVRKPNGFSCLVDAGNMLELIPPKPKGNES